MRSRHWVVVAALVLALGTVGPVAFADLTNGSFQTGDFTGWTEGGNFEDTGVSSNFAGYTPEDSEDYFAYLGPVGSDGTLSQSFTDVSGDDYVFSFWYDADGTNYSDFSAYWDINEVLLLYNPAITDGWTNYTFTETGTGIDSIHFDFRDDPYYDALDNVSVAGVSPIPEPSSFLLLGSGLVALGGFRRRFLK
jgi:hypothetical protein